MKLRPHLFALPVLASALLITACSSPANPRSVSVVVPKIEAAMRAATSAHMTGTVLHGSQNVTFDLSFVGNDLSGSVTDGSRSITITLISGSAFVKVDQNFLKEENLPAADCSSMCGKWVAVPAAQVRQAAASLNLPAITKLFVKSVPSAALSDNSDVFKPATLDGKAVLQFRPKATTIDVAASGQPYLLYFADPSEGSITFSQWNAVPPLTPPPTSDIINA